MKLRSYILIPLFIALTSSSYGLTPVDVNKYLSMRKKYTTSIPIATLKADASSYVGKIFEIRGTMSGCLQSDDTCSLIINAADGSSYSITAETSPVESPGLKLACLVKIGKQSKYSLSDLRLVACTYGAELERREAAAKAAAEEKKARAKAEAETAKERKKDYTSRSGNSTQRINAEEYVAAYRNAIKKFNRKLTERQADTIARSIIGFSLRYKLDARLVCSVILAESHFRISATSRAGAQGLGQLMPSTAAGLGVNNAYDPVENVYGSVRYIKGMLDRMSGNKEWNELTWYDLGLALAAYNAGPGAVKKHGGIPPYKETQAYVKRVVSIYKQLCGVKS